MQTLRIPFIALLTCRGGGWPLLGILLYILLSFPCVTKSKAADTSDTTNQQAQSQSEITGVGTTDISGPSGSAASPDNLLTNGSFKEGAFKDGGDGTMSLPVGSEALKGWTLMNGEAQWIKNGNSYNLSAEDDDFALNLAGTHHSLPYGGVRQRVATKVGNTYVLSFYLGVKPDVSVFSGPIAVQVSAGAHSSVINYDNPGPTGSGVVWQKFTYTFTAKAASTTISIVGTFDKGGEFIGLDHVSLEPSPAPPPSSTNLLSNGSFEDTTTFVPNFEASMSLQKGSKVLRGWTVVNAEIQWASDDYPYGMKAQDGHFSLDLTGYHDSPPYGGITQTVETKPGSFYLLTFYLGVIPNNAWGTAFGGPVSVLASAGPYSTTVTYDSGTTKANKTVWQKFTTRFKAVSTETKISIVGSYARGGKYIGLDNVSFTPDTAVTSSQSGTAQP